MMDKDKTVHSMYTIGMKKVGTAEEVAANMQLMSDLYGKEYTLKEIKENKLFSIIAIGVISYIPILCALLINIERLGTALAYFLITGATVIYTVFAARSWMPVMREVTDHSKWVEREMENPNLPRYKFKTMFPEHYSHLFKQRSVAAGLASKTVNQGQVYKVDYPLLPELTLPEGLKLMDKWLFEGEGRRFQIAVGDPWEEIVSYSILTVSNEPVQIDNQLIDQRFEVYGT